MSREALYFQCIGLLLLFAVRSYTAAPLEPFDLNAVRLTGHTAQTAAASLNAEYLLTTLDPDRLLWNFWNNADLQTKGTPYVKSWEDPSCELRGHFTGHYLTALSYVWRATGSQVAKTRLDYMVAELAKVQAALGGGYLSAFPKEFFDRLQSFENVWAPYYTIHKIMAGLLDAYTLADNKQAFEIVTGMASYFLGRIDETIQVNGTSHWVAMLEVEFGGMNEVMYNLYQLSKDPAHLRMAHLFDKPRFYEPLVKGIDILANLHANTHLAQVVGFMARYEATHDEAALKAVANFFNILTSSHSYVTGGSNDLEHWYSANWVGDAIMAAANSTDTEETCTQYNLLKIVRGLFQWSGDVKLADFYERALLNGIIGVSRIPYEKQPKQISGPQPVAVDNSEEEEEVEAPDDSNNDETNELAHQQATAAAAGKGTSNEDVSDAVDEGDVIESGAGAARRLLHADAASARLGHDGMQHGDHRTLQNMHDQHIRDAHMHPGHMHHDHMHPGHMHHDHMHPGHMHNDHMGHGHSFSHMRRSHSHDHIHNSHSHGDMHHGHSHDHDMHHGHGRTLQHMQVGPGRNHMHYMHEHHDHMPLPGISWEEDDSWMGTSHFHYPGRHLMPASDMKQVASGQVVLPHQRLHIRPYSGDFFGFNEPSVEENITNEPGPGRFLYMLPLGIGQAKGDGGHHWGFPHHSFWCCYGTAVESFAKLHDSIWFRNTSTNPPQLLLTQLTSSVLTWKEQGVEITLGTDLHGAGLSAHAALSFQVLGGKASVELALSLRIPSWAGSSGFVKLNGQPYEGCTFAPGRFCTITRAWRSGDSVAMELPYRVWFEKLQDKRLEYQGIKGLVMGPFVMAGLTHGDNQLIVNEAVLETKIVDPPQTKVITLKAGWNHSLAVRHDNELLYNSEIVDGSDASDAVFRVYKGCSSKNKAAKPMAEDAELLPERVIMLEALNMPGFFVGFHPAKSVLAMLPGDPLDTVFCRANSFVLEDASDTAEAAFMIRGAAKATHGGYMSAYLTPRSPDEADSCKDRHPKCDLWSYRGECDHNPGYMLKDCKAACGLCPLSTIALNMVEKKEDDLDTFVAASHFIIADAAVQLPLGSKILVGDNRNYLVAPLGNIIEERYTVYFNVSQPPLWFVPQ